MPKSLMIESLMNEIAPSGNKSKESRDRPLICNTSMPSEISRLKVPGMQGFPRHTEALRAEFAGLLAYWLTLVISFTQEDFIDR
jgi:hypothetical protein